MERAFLVAVDRRGRLLEIGSGRSQPVCRRRV